MSTMLQHLLMFYKYGGKQLYYFNTYDGAGEVDIDKMADSMLSSNDKTIEDFETQAEYDDYCESCVI